MSFLFGAQTMSLGLEQKLKKMSMSNIINLPGSIS